MKNPEVIYLEGLSHSGKTTLIKQIATDNPDTIAFVDEYVHPKLKEETDIDNQRIFMENDELKYRLARNSGKKCLVDRGHLSTVIYSHAYNKIRGDRDLSYVDNWYFGRILKNKMLPDLYILLDTSVITSLSRRTASLSWDNMWDNAEALKLARESYPLYMKTYEPNVPVITLDSNSLTIPQLKKQISSSLGLDISNYLSL